MIDVEFSFEEATWQREWDALEMDLTQKVVLLMETAGFESVSFLRSLTSAMRPPVRAGEGPRFAHPGGWADVTGNAANAYGFEVTVDGTVVAHAPPGPMDGTPERPVPTAPVELRRAATVPRSTQFVGLLMTNGVEYAVYLEALDGYYVLAGITDPGAPLYEALVRTARALGFEVR